jgi:hypothetical protein
MLFPNLVIRADDLARAMLTVVVGETGQQVKPILENRDIRSIVAARA